MTLDVVVVGGGISGLSTAWGLSKRGLKLRLLEAAETAGGTLRSERNEGFLIECGPNSTLENNPELGTLIDELGLRQARIAANPSAENRYVVRFGKPIPLPTSPGAFLTTPLFSASAKWRLLAEPFIAKAHTEESIAQFVVRRLGREFLDWAVDPFISGVYAGDPQRLSVQAATPKIYALEQRYGSLLRGAAARMTLHRHKTGPAPGGRLISFHEGMQVLAQGAVNALGQAVDAGKPVTRVSREEQGWRVESGNEQLLARQLVLAIPAYAAATLLAPLDPELEKELSAIHYPPVASVALGFLGGQIRRPLEGFGCLIPRREGIETLGAIFSSSLFPGRAPEGHVLLTAFIGGAKNPAVKDADDAELIHRVVEDLRPLLGITGRPGFVRVSKWMRAIPQYEIGHLGRLSRIDTRLAALPGLHLRANWRDGISVADCVKNGLALAKHIA
jgi:oxygen-dependent protoporphyrinogen oxidase